MFDLIDECGQDLSACGYESTTLSKFGVVANRLKIDSDHKAEKTGFAKGNYFILNAPLLANLMPEHFDFLKKEITNRLKFLFLENKLKKNAKVLFVGIGNPQIISDYLGVKTVEKININSFKKNNRIYKIMPNVFSNTGINAYEMIKLVVECFDISAVILVDSLATTNIFRLGCSIQLNDAGLTPGSALNNFGKAISKKTLNVPCFSIGVPMMIAASVFEKKSDLILTEKDVEEKVEFLSRLLAECLNDLFGQT